jgi:hypothetical protein
VDKEAAVMAQPAVKTAELPLHKLIYPDLNITTVMLPTLTSYGTDMTFIAHVGNESLATVSSPLRSACICARPEQATGFRSLARECRE